MGQELSGSVCPPWRKSPLMHVSRASGIEGTVITPRYLILLANPSLHWNVMKQSSVQCCTRNDTSGSCFPRATAVGPKAVLG